MLGVAPLVSGDGYDGYRYVVVIVWIDGSSGGQWRTVQWQRNTAAVTVEKRPPNDRLDVS